MKLQAPTSKLQRITKFQTLTLGCTHLETWCLVLLWMLVLGAWSFSADAAPKPNILLIIADDYGVDSSSLYNTVSNGASLPPTPNIVSLAQNGVVFGNAWSNPVCSPTRACMMTGRYSFRTGVGDVVAGAGSVPLSASEFTLPEAFAANPALGYHLAQFGKWHLANGPNSPRTVGGWTNFSGSLIGVIANYTNWTKTVNGVSSTSTNYATSDTVNDAVTWIQARGTNPWLAWVAFNAPHTPLHLPPTNLCPHYATLPGTPSDIAANPRNYFEAMTEAMDTETGRLLASVDRAKTHIIFLGDNGTQGVVQPPYPANRDKGTLYEGGIRVPFIVSGPAVVNPGRTNDTPVGAVDLFSTMLEMAGIDLATTVPTNVMIDSQSLMPILTSNATLPRYAYSELFGSNVVPAGAPGRALRNGQFKLVLFNNGQKAFYDLVNDAYEATNLLSGAPTATQQSNYYGLTLKLAGYQAALAQPIITASARSDSQFAVTIQRTTNFTYALWRAPRLDDLAWVSLTNAVVMTNGATAITLIDTNAIEGQSFYRVLADSP